MISRGRLGFSKYNGDDSVEGNANKGGADGKPSSFAVAFCDKRPRLIVHKIHSSPYGRGNRRNTLYRNGFVIFIDMRHILLNDGGIARLKDNIRLSNRNCKPPLQHIDHLLRLMVDRLIGILGAGSDLKRNEHRFR